MKENDSKNYAKRLAKAYTKNYTNEHICKQIEDNSILFRFFIVMLLLGVYLIIKGYVGDNSEMYFLFVKNPVPFSFGVTILIVTGVCMHTVGSVNMMRHIRPKCSGRRYSAQEIDEQANHPETVWLDKFGIFVTPKAFIAIRKGLTVIAYEDIADIITKTEHRSERTGSSSGGTLAHKNPGRAMYSALTTGNYREWDTYYIIAKTNNNKKMVLARTNFKGYNELIPIVNEKCSNVEVKTKDE